MSAFAIYQSVASGIATGCIYALLAISLVVIFKSTAVVNFAGGDALMSGAYLALLALVYFDLPYVAAFGFAALGVFIIAGGFEYLVLRSISRRERHGPAIEALQRQPPPSSRSLKKRLIPGTDAGSAPPACT